MNHLTCPSCGKCINKYKTSHDKEMFNLDGTLPMSIKSELMGLAPYTEVVNLRQGESLDEQGSGLFFIQHGILVSIKTLRIYSSSRRRTLSF